jgi:hypothetical protein
LPLDIMLLDMLDFPRLHERSGLLKDGFETGAVELRMLEVDEGSDFPRALLLRNLRRHYFP